MNQIAFVTTCKGRLSHLQETLPLLAAQAPQEIVVVDYGCPQGSGDWVAAHFPAVKVVRVTDDPGFHLPRARNLGASACHSRWLCFIDADIRIGPGFVDWLRKNIRERHFYRQAPVAGIRDPEAYGTSVCMRRAFRSIGGYDELFTGWGGEDDDLYDRFALAGLTASHYPAEMVAPISHDDAERMAFHEVKSKDLQHILNAFYRRAKLQIMALQGIRTELPLAIRQEIRERTVAAVSEWGGDLEKPLPVIRLSLKQTSWLPSPYRLLSNCTLNLSMDIAEAE